MTKKNKKTPSIVTYTVIGIPFSITEWSPPVKQVCPLRFKTRAEARKACRSAGNNDEYKYNYKIVKLTARNTFSNWKSEFVR